MTVKPSPYNQDIENYNKFHLKIIILGGGFGGVYCAKSLKKHINNSNISLNNIGLVSDHNYMVFQPMLAEVAGASIQPRHIINPIRQICKGIKVIRGKVKEINLSSKKVTIDTGKFSSHLIISFDHLVFALGAEIDLSRVPGMPEHAMLMQNIGDAMILRSTIISRIEEANFEHREDIKKRLLTFVVVGGGFSGVETAGEILDLIIEMVNFYQNISKKDIKVCLIHSKEKILNTLDSKLSEYAEKKLLDRGLKIYLNERVSAVTATKVYFKSGNIIDTATVISTVGTSPNKIIKSLCENKELPNEKFRIKTNSKLQVQSSGFLWAIGDCALIPLYDKNKNESVSYCPQTAQFAIKQGEAVAKNIINSLNNKETVDFKFKGLGELASIGYRAAVANIFGIQFSGFLAWFLWRAIYLSKLPGLDRKLRVMIDWSLDLFFPRDINLLNPKYSSVFRQVHLEPNDKLFTRGEPSFSLYVIEKGQIDLIDENGKVVRSIYEGDFFGERALTHNSGYLYNAVSKGQTKLFSLNGEVVLPFFLSSSRFRRIISKTTAQASAEEEHKSLISKLNFKNLDDKVSTIMHKDVATLKIDQTIEDALNLFKKRRFSIYPVLDKKNKFIYSLSREDIFDFIKKKNSNSKTSLSEVTTMDIPVCSDDDTIKDALEKMIRLGRYKCIVISKDKKLSGIITIMDLI